MELIIDIPDEEYNRIKEWEDNITGYQTSLVLYHAVRNGTPYEHKGDLISREELKKALNYTYDCAYIDSKSKEGIVSDIIETIDNTPTVDAYTFNQVKELFDLNVQMADEIENLKRIQGEYK